MNGSRRPDEHPSIPRTPVELALAARDAVTAGARLVHLHAYDDDGETFEAGACAAALHAVREACPGTSLSLTTSADVEPDPERRRRLVAEWTELPDVVTANQGEDGIAQLCLDLLARGVGIEAGLLELADAQAFVASGLAPRCTRVLVEPLDVAPADAVAHAEAMEALLAEGGVQLEQIHHGEGIASWAVNERASRRGHGLRTGLEDTTVLPDGTLAADNAALVRAAVRLASSL